MLLLISWLIEPIRYPVLHHSYLDLYLNINLKNELHFVSDEKFARGVNVERKKYTTVESKIG